MNLLLVVDDLDAPGDHLPDPVTLARLADHVVVAGPNGQGRAVAPRAVALRVGTGSLRSPRSLLAALRAAGELWLRSPRRAARLWRACKQGPGGTLASCSSWLRHAPLGCADADVVHYGSVRLARSLPELGAFLGAASVVTCLGAEIEAAERVRPRDRGQFRRAITHAASVHCPSEALARRCRSVTGRSTGIVVVRPRVVVPESTGHTQATGPPLVVARAPFSFDGGLDVLIGALGRVRDAGVAFRSRLEGRGPLRSRLQWAVDDLGLSSLVDVVDDGNVPDAASLAEADVYVATGQGDTIDRHAPLAMALGVPVVACSDDAGTGELVRDGIDGFVVAGGDVAALADRLTLLLRARDVRQRMGTSAREQISRELSADAQVAAFMAAYRDTRTEPAATGRTVEVPASAVGLRVARYTASFPKHPGHYQEILAIIDAGVDLHVYAEEPSAYWERFPDLHDRPELAERVHFLTHRRRAPWPVPSLVHETVTIAGRRPRAFARFVAHNWRTRATNGLGFWRGWTRRLAFARAPLDLVHVESDTWVPAVADLKALLRCPMLLSAITSLQRTPIAEEGRAGYARIFAPADAYHFLSCYLQENTVSLGLSGVPMWVLQHGIDAERYVPDPSRRPGDGPELRVLSVARLIWEKGIDWGIRAVAAVHEQGIPVHYTIVGEGPDHAALARLARRLGIEDAVEFLGDLPSDAVIAEYRRADVFLHAALEEGWGFAVTEAQTMGLPVVTTRTGGLPENVIDGETGFVVAPRDAAALTERLMALARDQGLAARVGAAGRARALDRFDLQRQAARFAAMYADVAHGTRFGDVDGVTGYPRSPVDGGSDGG